MAVGLPPVSGFMSFVFVPTSILALILSGWRHEWFWPGYVFGIVTDAL